jgi:transcriptional regulator with XRE-family HTH domain
MLQIGSNIRWIRLLRGETQEQFGRQIGCSKDALATYEKGRTIPNELIKSKIATIAGITIEELETQDLKNKTINVINPDTKLVEFTLRNTTPDNGTDEKEQELMKRIIELETEVKVLKEMNDKLLEKR